MSVPPSPDAPDPAERYRRRRDRFRERRERTGERSTRIGRLRLAAFVAAVALFLLAERAASPAALALGVGGAVATAGFLLLVRRHRRLRARSRRLAELALLNDEALARLRRDFDALPPPAPAPDLRDHPYAGDLDVLGTVSLERLLSTVSTGPGARTLRGWLLGGAGPEEVAARQEAVAELAPRVDFRQELAAGARLAGLDRSDRLSSFLAWTEETSWLEGRGWLLWTARAVPPATLLLFLLHLGGATALPWWGLGLLAGIIYAGRYGGATGEVLDRISGGRGALSGYGPVFRRLEELRPRCALLEGVRDRLGRGDAAASRALRRLDRRVTMADVRHNDLLHFPLQALLFWDVHMLWLLERWRRTGGDGVRSWFGALGDAEALAALALLRADHPGWCFPELGAGSVYAAGELGHPLLPGDDCVRNDVEIGPPGTFLLLTGSNMAGKSTLLRAVGTNAVLAQAGAPVCARRLRMPALSVTTSMRTEDSLAEGVSEFMAELRRVRLVVDAARDGDAGAVPLYLLDEPLQGTNEAERRTALRIVLGHLLDTSAIGAVATHDLRLHRTDRLEEAARPVHFTSRVREVDGELRLTFDYRLREGPATSTNALDLLRLVGLGEESGDDGPRIT